MSETQAAAPPPGRSDDAPSTDPARGRPRFQLVSSVVEAGDTLSKVAARFGVTTDTVIKKILEETPEKEGALQADDRFKKIFAS